jgi:hypothetical protein
MFPFDFITIQLALVLKFPAAPQIDGINRF